MLAECAVCSAGGIDTREPIVGTFSRITATVER